MCKYPKTDSCSRERAVHRQPARLVARWLLEQQRTQAGDDQPERQIGGRAKRRLQIGNGSSLKGLLDACTQRAARWNRGAVVGGGRIAEWDDFYSDSRNCSWQLEHD